MNNDDNIYKVDSYSEKELFDILDVFNPTDRELEAKILYFIDKYSNSTNIDNIKLHTFFVDIYKRFFYVEEDEEEDEDEYEIEGFSNLNNNDNNIINTNTNTNTNANVQLISSLNYAKGKLNPLLKQTYQRIITIDSQYRDSKNSVSTQFTLNFSEILKDVVSLKLYAVQIPYTWYTISKSYGSNFLYIKGKSPGINNGNHDIEISIPPGNYSLTTVSNATNTTNNSISSAIQNAIQKLPNIYTDISFGNTNLSYDINQCKATFNIDIQKQYNESYYYFNFLGDFYSPYPPDESNNPNRTKYLSCFLGFNSKSYSTCSVYSVRTLQDFNNNASIYGFNATNNYIYIIQYSNDNNGRYIPGISISYETIKIEFPITDPSNVYKISQSSIFNIVKDTICSHPKLNRPKYKGIDSSVNFFQITGKDICGNNVANYGSYYYQWQIKLNRFNVQNIPNYKTVLIVPDDTSIWTGTTSCFGFKSTINELNDLVSESYVPYSNYKVSGISFFFKCNNPNYDISGLNDFSYNLTNDIYSLDNLINEINNGFSIINSNFTKKFKVSNILNINNLIKNVYQPSPQTIAYYNTTDSKFHVSIDINNIFSTEYFVIDISNTNCLLKNLFDISAASVSIKDLSDNTILLGYGKNTIITITDPLLMVIYPNVKYCESRGISKDISYNIRFDNSVVGLNYTVSTISTLIESTIQSFQDVSYSTPLKESTFTIRFINNNENIQPTLNIKIQKIITQNEYTVWFYDSSFNNGVKTDLSNSFWYSKFELDTSYNLDPGLNTSFTDINGNKIIDSDSITITSVNNNNIIELIPIDDGVTGYGIVRFEIPPATYNRISLFEKINKLFDSNSITKGTKISYINDSNKYEYTQIRWNVNKVYTSQDYKLVFYDIYSFVSCFLGNSSVRNATWDTTLGWIMGFHDLQEYPLTSENLKNGYYYDISNTTLTNNEYTVNTDISYRTLVSLTGDTTVSINLYNYFMVILDDFNPSHLNDGLITVTPTDNNLSLPSYANRAKYICDPVTKNVLNTGITDVASNNLTRNQIYSINQIINTQNTTKSNTNSGVYVSDIFGLIPIKTSGYNPGQTYVEYGGTLQAQDRIYFGPVNIHRVAISLINDRGELVDLNNANWSLQFICEQLYQNNNDVKP